MRGKGACKEFDGKAVVAGGNGSMSREDTLAANFFDVAAVDGFASSPGRFLAQEFEREKRSVAFIHVIARDVIVAE